jgi:hypothetical protein
MDAERIRLLKQEFDLLCLKCDIATVREIVYCVYSSPHTNRFFLDDCLDLVTRSGFHVSQATPVFELQVPGDVQEELLRRYPERSNFGHSGLLLALEHRDVEVEACP